MVTGGLTAEEIIEILLMAGMNSQVISVDISDFNPASEDFRTGTLVANLIYFFLLGLSKRK
jgi:formiminoglutamase